MLNDEENGAIVMTILAQLSLKQLVSLADPGGAVSAPPMRSNSFIFAYVFAEKRPR